MVSPKVHRVFVPPTMFHATEYPPSCPMTLPSLSTGVMSWPTRRTVKPTASSASDVPATAQHAVIMNPTLFIGAPPHSHLGATLPSLLQRAIGVGLGLGLG